EVQRVGRRAAGGCAARRRAPGRLRRAVAPGRRHESRCAALAAEGGGVREIVLRRRQTGRCDLPWTMDRDRGWRGEGAPYHVVAIARDGPRECRGPMGG